MTLLLLAFQLLIALTTLLLSIKKFIILPNYKIKKSTASTTMIGNKITQIAMVFESQLGFTMGRKLDASVSRGEKCACRGQAICKSKAHLVWLVFQFVKCVEIGRRRVQSLVHCSQYDNSSFFRYVCGGVMHVGAIISISIVICKQICLLLLFPFESRCRVHNSNLQTHRVATIGRQCV